MSDKSCKERNVYDLRPLVDRYYNEISSGESIESNKSNAIYCYNSLNKCKDCQFWNREKIAINERFLRVCNPPHELVFAKVGSHPYWPSKVIHFNQQNGEYLVQFFELRPQLFSTAFVPQNKIKDINYKLHSRHLRKPEVIQSFALLYKYLNNLREVSTNFSYNYLINKLERLLRTKWEQNCYSFLEEFNFSEDTNELMEVTEEITNSKFDSLKSSQELARYEHLRSHNKDTDKANKPQIHWIQTINKQFDYMKIGWTTLNDQ